MDILKTLLFAQLLGGFLIGWPFVLHLSTSLFVFYPSLSLSIYLPFSLSGST